MKVTRETKEDGSFVETSTFQQSSIKVSKNAKGDYSSEVKVYDDNEGSMTTRLVEFTVIAEKRIRALQGENRV